MLQIRSDALAAAAELSLSTAPQFQLQLSSLAWSMGRSYSELSACDMTFWGVCDSRHEPFFGAAQVSRPIRAHCDHQHLIWPTQCVVTCTPNWGRTFEPHFRL